MIDNPSEEATKVQIVDVPSITSKVPFIAMASEVHVEIQVETLASQAPKVWRLYSLTCFLVSSFLYP